MQLSPEEAVALARARLRTIGSGGYFALVDQGVPPELVLGISGDGQGGFVDLNVQSGIGIDDIDAKTVERAIRARIEAEASGMPFSATAGFSGPSIPSLNLPSTTTFVDPIIGSIIPDAVPPLNLPIPTAGNSLSPDPSSGEGSGDIFRPPGAPTQLPMDPSVTAGSGVGGILGAILDGLQTGVMTLPAILPILQGLANAGVIRGSVGDALTGSTGGDGSMVTPTPSAGNSMVPITGGAPASLFGGLVRAAPALARTLLQLIRRVGIPAAREFAILVGAEAIFNELLDAIESSGSDPMEGGTMDEMRIQELLMQLQQLQSLGGGGMMGGPASCPSIFRQRRQGFYIPSRVQVQGPDGQIYVLANLGRATRGSRETSVLKRLAKDNGFVTRRRTSGG